MRNPNTPTLEEVIANILNDETPKSAPAMKVCKVDMNDLLEDLMGVMPLNTKPTPTPTHTPAPKAVEKDRTAIFLMCGEGNYLQPLALTDEQLELLDWLMKNEWLLEGTSWECADDYSFEVIG